MARSRGTTCCVFFFVVVLPSFVGGAVSGVRFFLFPSSIHTLGSGVRSSLAAFCCGGVHTHLFLLFSVWTCVVVRVHTVYVVTLFLYCSRATGWVRCYVNVFYRKIFCVVLACGLPVLSPRPPVAAFTPGRLIDRLVSACIFGAATCTRFSFRLFIWFAPDYSACFPRCRPFSRAAAGYDFLVTGGSF